MTDIAVQIWKAASTLQKAISQAENAGYDVVIDTRNYENKLLIDVGIYSKKEVSNA